MYSPFTFTGEEDQTLAGLVPSQSFQHQRESMRLAAEERMSKPQRKSSTLLCGKTPKRKKKKGAYADAGYPIYANAVDGKIKKYLQAAPHKMARRSLAHVMQTFPVP